MHIYIYKSLNPRSDMMTHNLNRDSLPMSTLNHLFDLPEQICYVQCGFCDTILLVSVPCSSLSMVVTVRCGHCTSLLSVNMMKVSFVPFHHLLASLTNDHQQKEEVNLQQELEARKTFDTADRSSASSDNELDKEDKNHPVNRVINKPPEKRQRAPSAYNCFIKEEIRRLKAENPNMAHKEAFSAAAKNWANFPPIHYGGENCCGQEEEKAAWSRDAAEVNNEGNKSFLERKAPRHSIWARTPSK